MTTPKNPLRAALAAGLMALAAAASAQAAEAARPQGTLIVSSNFSTRLGDWIEASRGFAELDSTAGHAAPSLRINIPGLGMEGVNFLTHDPAWLAALTSQKTVDFGLRTQTNSILYQGRQVPRDLIVEIRDYDNPPVDHPYTSVWAYLGTLRQANKPWKWMHATIPDTTATALPEGWSGYGAEDAKGHPFLPADRNFADVLAHADEILITTLVPGYLYSMDVQWDVAVDDIYIARPAQ